MLNTLFLHHLKKYFSFLLCALCLAALPSCAQTDAAPKATPNLAQNASFEEGAQHWNIPADSAKVVADAAHSGNHSLYYTNTDNKRYKLFTQKVTARPGQKLAFSAWVKGRDIAGNGGAGVFMEAYGEGHIYLGGSYPSTFKSTFGWKQARGRYTVPQNATEVTVGLYLRSGVTGAAWFDDVDVRVLPPEPFAAFLQYPNYRGTLVHGDASPWKYLVEINPEVVQGKFVTVQTQLTDAAGKVLLEQNKNIAAGERSTTIIINPPKNLAVGIYTLSQQIKSDGTESLAQKYPIRVVKEMPKVYMDKQGFTVVNGKRFFPMGLYLGPTDDKTLKRISKGGYNTILSYSYGTGKDPKAFLERAQEQNLKVIYSLKDFYPGLHGYAEEAFDIAKSYATSLQDSPSLLAWYINDERDTSWLPKLGKMYDQLNLLDANHPAYQVLLQTGGLQKYFYTTDVLGTDPYPVGQPNLTKTANYTQSTVAAAHQAKGLWMVLQMHDLGVYYQNVKPHAPTLDEMRNQAYQALINGAKGLLWYSYFDLQYTKYPRGKETASDPLFHQRWNDATRMATEINKITPAILADQKVLLNLPAKADLEVAAWKQGNQLALLFANPYYETKSITFTLPQGWIIKDAEQGEIKSTFANDKATFTLPSVGSGVFYLMKEA